MCDCRRPISDEALRECFRARLRPLCSVCLTEEFRRRRAPRRERIEMRPAVRFLGIEEVTK